MGFKKSIRLLVVVFAFFWVLRNKKFLQFCVGHWSHIDIKMCAQGVGGRIGKRRIVLPVSTGLVTHCVSPEFSTKNWTYWLKIWWKPNWTTSNFLHDRLKIIQYKINILDYQYGQRKARAWGRGTGKLTCGAFGRKTFSPKQWRTLFCIFYPTKQRKIGNNKFYAKNEC